MDPTAQDRWWKKRIEKEERAYVEKVAQDEHSQAPSSVMLNSLSVAQECPASHSQYISNYNGSLVAKARSIARGSRSDISTGSRSSRGFVGSTISSRVMEKMAELEGRNISSYPRSLALKSEVSYPRTPTFSAAGSRTTAADTEILRRLTRLEHELEEERHRREVAQHEMAALLDRVGTPSTSSRDWSS